jgi:hypothetical protein
LGNFFISISSIPGRGTPEGRRVEVDESSATAGGRNRPSRSDCRAPDSRPSSLAPGTDGPLHRLRREAGAALEDVVAADADAAWNRGKFVNMYV